MGSLEHEAGGLGLLVPPCRWLEPLVCTLENSFNKYWWVAHQAPCRAARVSAHGSPVAWAPGCVTGQPGSPRAVRELILSAVIGEGGAYIQKKEGWILAGT